MIKVMVFGIRRTTSAHRRFPLATVTTRYAINDTLDSMSKAINLLQHTDLGMRNAVTIYAPAGGQNYLFIQTCTIE